MLPLRAYYPIIIGLIRALLFIILKIKIMSTGRIQARKTEAGASTLPEIGKIKIGEKKTNANNVEYPTSLDYFRATGNFANQFTAVYGAKPTKLNIVFISDDLAEVCNERYESWVKGKRFGWGDGKDFWVWDSNTKSYQSVPADSAQVKALKWEMMLTLRFVLLEMRGIIGYWSFTTKALKTTIPSVVKSFDYVRERAGTIIAFPFTLTVEKRKGFSPEEPKNYPVVSLVGNFSQESIDQVREYLNQGNKIAELNTKMISAEQVLVKQLTGPGEAPSSTLQG